LTFEEAGDQSWVSASLRIHSQKLSAQEIDKALSTTATKKFEIGDPVSKTNPKVKRSESLWLLESGVAGSMQLEEHLIALLAFAEDRKQALAAIRNQCEVDLFCGFSSGSGQGSMVLSAGTLARIAALRIDLCVDLYPPGSDRASPGSAAH
jgi:Domain of unknown function (DUF4279)